MRFDMADGAAMTASPMTTPSPPRLAVFLGALGRAMITTGVVVLFFVVYQLWGTDLQEARSQSGLRDDLTTRFEAAASALDQVVVTTVPKAETEPQPEPDPDRITAPTESTSSTTTTTTTTTLPGGVDPDLLALLFPEDGDALAKIEIPSLDVDKVVVRGIAVADLRKGPGHYPQTPLPGNQGNSAIAGHRTTYGKPFNRIDELVPGDEITVTSVQGEFHYKVLDASVAFGDHADQVDEFGAGHIIVKPSATWVLNDFGDDRLTLTACHPKLSSRQRIIVAAELIDDTVALPEWAINAEAARQAAESNVINTVADSSADQPAADQLGADETPPETAPPVTADLDEGLSGERGAVPGAIAWMVGAIAFWFAGGWAGRRWGTSTKSRLAMRFAGLVPAIALMWFSFEMIDRALPAG